MKAHCPCVDQLVTVPASSASRDLSQDAFLTAAAGNACRIKSYSQGQTTPGPGTCWTAGVTATSTLHQSIDMQTSSQQSCRCLHRVRGAGGPGSFFPPACVGYKMCLMEMPCKQHIAAV